MIDIKKIEAKLDEVLSKETAKSLKEFINRQKDLPESMAIKDEDFWKVCTGEEDTVPPSEEVVKKVLELFGEFLETTPVGRDVKNIISIAPNNPESIEYIINNWSK